MDAEYLKQNIGDPLASGLAAVVINQPDDPVDYLALWLHKYVDNHHNQIKAAAESAQHDVWYAQHQEAENEERKQQQLKESKRDAQVQREKEFNTLLVETTESDTLLDKFVEFLKINVNAAAVYLAKLQVNPNSNDVLKYISATNDHKFILDNKLDKGEGVTFDLFEALPEVEVPEPADDEDPEVVAAAAAAKAAADNEPRFLHVPHVLLGPNAPRIRFFRLPRLGAYLAVRLTFTSLLYDEALASAAAEAARQAAQPPKPADDKDVKDDDDDDPEAVASRKAEKSAAQAEAEAEEASRRPQPQPVEYVICLDSLGQDRQFTPEEIARVRAYSKQLSAALTRIDRITYSGEVAKHLKLAQANADLQAKADAEKDDDKTQEIEALKAEVGAEQALFALAKKKVMSLKEMIAEFKTYNVFRGPLEILQVLFYLLDYDKESVSDATGEPSWKKIRNKFTDDLFQKISNYDPRVPQPRGPKQKYAKVEALAKILDGWDYDSVRPLNYPLAEIYSYLRASLESKRAAKQLREEEKARAKAEAKAAAAKKKADEKAAKLAAAEAAAAADAAAAAAAAGVAPADDDGDGAAGGGDGDGDGDAADGGGDDRADGDDDGDNGGDDA